MTLGYNNDELHAPVVCDLETVPMDGAADYVPPPDLDAIQAAKNLKDPSKIQDDVAKRRAEAMAAHAEKLGKAALDFNLARIVALGWTEPDGSVLVECCEDELAEAGMLARFWKATTACPYIGFRIRTFDMPMLMARSRYLGVRHPLFDLGRYGRGGRITDLWDVLSFGLSDYDTTNIMPRRLKTYATRYGLMVDDDVDGKDIGALVLGGDWNRVIQHVTSDVRLTTAMARRLGVLQPEAVRV